MPPSRELGGDGSWLRAHPGYHPAPAPEPPEEGEVVDPGLVGADERGCAGVKLGMSQLDQPDGFKAFIGVQDGRFLTTVTMTVPSVAALQIARVEKARIVSQTANRITFQLTSGGSDFILYGNGAFVAPGSDAYDDVLRFTCTGHGDFASNPAAACDRTKPATSEVSYRVDHGQNADWAAAVRLSKWEPGLNVRFFYPSVTLRVKGPYYGTKVLSLSLRLGLSLSRWAVAASSIALTWDLLPLPPFRFASPRDVGVTVYLGTLGVGVGVG